MKLSDKGRAALISEEGFRTKAYRDSVGIWTIGVGHTAAAGAPAPKPGMVITRAEVDEIFARDVVKYENTVNNKVTVPLNQNEFDALVSLCFNIGQGAFAKSSVVRLLNKEDRKGAADAFLMWKKAGNDLDILLPRRKRERTLFLTPSVVVSPPVIVEEPVAPSKPELKNEPSFWGSVLVMIYDAIKGKR